MVAGRQRSATIPQSRQGRLNVRGRQVADSGIGQQLARQGRGSGAIGGGGCTGRVDVGQRTALDQSDDTPGAVNEQVGMLGRVPLGDQVGMELVQQVADRQTTNLHLSLRVTLDHPGSDLGGLGLGLIGHFLRRPTIRATFNLAFHTIGIDETEVPYRPTLPERRHCFAPSPWCPVALAFSAQLVPT
ncbi:hypothetical protein [Singulisphaera sp. GP187]|uniref:hypothetical protein n=1 Tax=Singulisphaera sp. GP187 TaxID=1882752 RepID=UPI0009413E70|nr:hypothetical protein [Singulisphaera sp. GP187]